MGRTLLVAFDTKIIMKSYTRNNNTSSRCVADSLEEKYTLVSTQMMPQIKKTFEKKLACSNLDLVPLLRLVRFED